MSIRIVAFAGADLRTRQGEVVEVYREAFTPPPYNKSRAEIEEFAQSFPTQWQAKGIGGRLHNCLLAGLPHDCALLGTMQADTAAYRLYRKLGWAVLAQDLAVPGIARRYQIMGLDLDLWQSPGTK